MFVCTQCDAEYSEKPKVCKECQGIDFIETEVSIKEEIKTGEVGFRSKPQLIKKMFDLITIPISSTKNTFPSFILTKKGNDIFINESNGNSVYALLRFYKNYFDEIWGADKSRIPLNSEKALKFIDLMRSYNAVSLNYNDDQGIVAFYNGKKDIISTRCEITETITTCSDIRENHSNKPVPFDEEAFVPIVKGSKNFYNGCKIKVNVSELMLIIKRAEKFNTDFYPFLIENGNVVVGVNDMKNPDGDGAFTKVLDCIIETEPTEPIKCELGKMFGTIISNLDGEIEIIFAGSNMPIWIQGTITNDSDEIIGRFGYVLPPRSV